ncbi:hypothetical protein SKC35_02950 [Aquirufa sp. KTFRIE-69F]|uniref:Uncharacterized protein n=1 Tax=Aquirufa originis TaxID=3096514 RepID=A0ABW6D335_9BACT
MSPEGMSPEGMSPEGMSPEGMSPEGMSPGPFLLRTSDYRLRTIDFGLPDFLTP